MMTNLIIEQSYALKFPCKDIKVKGLMLFDDRRVVTNASLECINCGDLSRIWKQTIGFVLKQF